MMGKITVAMYMQRQREKFRVKALSFNGLRNKIFSTGDIITGNDFHYWNKGKLLQDGFIEYIIPVVKVGVLIITRGDRPRFMAQARLMLGRQTLQPNVVAVVDDPPQNGDIDITWRYRTGCQRLWVAGCDVVICWEDDDWYRHDYIERMVTEWNNCGRPPLFGLAHTIYYNIRTGKYVELRHKGRASMMQTLIGRDAVIEWCDDHYAYTDAHLWKTVRGGVAVSIGEHISLSIKHGEGLCGGGGHTDDFAHYNKEDADRTLLRSITGEDFTFYDSFFKYQFEKKKYAEHPFLSIVTRRYKRPLGLAKNQASIEALADRDLEQIFITDPVGYGLHAANRSFAYVTSMIEGQYVFLLDDDDFISNENMIGELKHVAAMHDPDVIFFRMIIRNNMNNNYYPTEQTWGREVKIAHIGGSCLVVKRKIYERFIHHFNKARCGDFYFIDAVVKSGASVYWLDKLMCETGKVSRGKPEEITNDELRMTI